MSEENLYHAIEFDHEALFSKAKLYVNKFTTCSKDDEWWFLWLSLSLEFLLRAALSKSSPALLADNTKDEYLLAALGYKMTGAMKSIPTNKVLERLGKINIRFSESEQNKAKTIIEARNAELHTGISGFNIIPKDTVVKDYYVIAKVLLNSLGKSFEDYLGDDDAKLAINTLQEVSEEIKKRVTARLAHMREEYNALTNEEKHSKMAKIDTFFGVVQKYTKEIECPSCKNKVLILGEKIKIQHEEHDNYEIRQEIVCIPRELKCMYCNFYLKGLPEFKALNLEKEFIINETFSPLEYYQIDIEEYIDDDMKQRIVEEYNDGGGYMDE